MPTDSVKPDSSPIEMSRIAKLAPETARYFVKGFATETPRLLTGALLLLSLFLAATGGAQAQTIHAHISVISLAPAKIRVDAELPLPTDVLSFRNSYSGVIGLGDRIQLVRARNSEGKSLLVKQLAPGEFRTIEKVRKFSYDVNLSEPSAATQMARVSWLNRDVGLFMLADLLPLAARDSSGLLKAQIEIAVPAGWSITSNMKHEGRSQYSTEDSDTAILLAGAFLKATTGKTGNTKFSLVTSHQWPFSNNKVEKVAKKILEDYTHLTGYNLRREPVLMLLPFPGGAGPEKWSAETRDNTVVLILGSQGKSQTVLAKLAIVLAHEFFHLWVPNSLKLAGEYDWFFEGFTLYQALLADLRFGWITFDDYLNTIARVHHSYSSLSDHERLSLIDASERRWTTTGSLVYEKGMLAAFIYDLKLRNLTDCRRSIEDVYRRLFTVPMTGQENANETIIRILGEPEGLESFGRNYVQRGGDFDLDGTLASYGLQLQKGPLGTQLVVRQDLDKSQRKLLRCLGYRK